MSVREEGESEPASERASEREREREGRSSFCVLWLAGLSITHIVQCKR